MYHVSVDFKRTFDRVWHAALWTNLRTYNINANRINVIQHVYDMFFSAVYLKGRIRDWFGSTVAARQGCLLSPTLFNFFSERFMTDALENHTDTVKIGRRTISN